MPEKMYSMGKSKLHGLQEGTRQWLTQHPTIEAILWFLGSLTCIAILVWFLGLSGFGSTPEFVYEQF